MNCTVVDVRKIIHTSLTDAKIKGIITTNEAEITKKAGSRVTGELARKLSTLITASVIKTRQPDSSAIGAYQEVLHEERESFLEGSPIFIEYKGKSGSFS